MPKELNAAEMLQLMEKRAVRKGAICGYCLCSPELCVCHNNEVNKNETENES